MHQAGDRFVGVYNGEKKLFDKEEDALVYEAEGMSDLPKDQTDRKPEEKPTESKSIQRRKKIQRAEPKANAKKVRPVRKKKRK